MKVQHKKCKTKIYFVVDVYLNCKVPKAANQGL